MSRGEQLQGEGDALKGRYTSTVGFLEPSEWAELLAGFRDANLFQTWSYGGSRWGRRQLSHWVLRERDRVLAIAQARLIGSRASGALAYVSSGPLWRPEGEEVGPERFQQVIRAMRADYCSTIKASLRLAPYEFVSGPLDVGLAGVLRAEGFKQSALGRETFFVDLRRELAEVRRSLRPRWRTTLNAAGRQGLSITQGCEPELFDEFEKIYDEMRQEKRFSENVSVPEMRRVQLGLEANQQMNVAICRQGETPLAGAITSHLGEVGIAALWATNAAGRKLGGSYYLQWKLVEWLHSRGCLFYDLGGVDKAANPGGYRFKAGLAGRPAEPARLVGSLDAHGSLRSAALTRIIDAAKILRDRTRSAS